VSPNPRSASTLQLLLPATIVCEGVSRTVYYTDTQVRPARDTTPTAPPPKGRGRAGVNSSSFVFDEVAAPLSRALSRSLSARERGGSSSLSQWLRSHPPSTQCMLTAPLSLSRRAPCDARTAESFHRRSCSEPCVPGA
jgi:hypothetical protein